VVDGGGWKRRRRRIARLGLREGVTFDVAKNETMFLSKRRKEPTETVWVGDCEIQFDRHATLWLGIWIDSNMTLKAHHAER